MKIAIPLHEGKFCEHFGGAEAFAFYTPDADNGSIGKRLFGIPPEHGRGIFPMWLRQQGTTVVLAGGMGPRAAGILAHHGIEVVTGVHGEDPDALAQGYLDGSLEATGEVCHDHNHHDCGHDHDQHDCGPGHAYSGRGGCHDD